MLVIKIKPSEALSSLKQYKRTRHSLCLLTINVISNAKEYKRTDGPTRLPVDKLQYIQGEFEGVLPEDLRRRTDSNKIWRTILAQNYLKQNLAHDFGAAFNNLITVFQENIKQ